MLLAPCSDGERKHDLEPTPGKCLAPKIECVYLAECVSETLRRTGHASLRDIGISVRNGAVHLEGKVASYYQKQLAQEAVRQVICDAAIRNDLTVTYRWEFD